MSEGIPEALREFYAGSGDRCQVCDRYRMLVVVPPEAAGDENAEWAWCIVCGALAHATNKTTPLQWFRPRGQERTRAIWRVLSDQSVCSPDTFDTEAEAEAMFVKCDAVDPGAWRVVSYVLAAAIRQEVDGE